MHRRRRADHPPELPDGTPLAAAERLFVEGNQVFQTAVLSVGYPNQFYHITSLYKNSTKVRNQPPDGEPPRPAAENHRHDRCHDQRDAGELFRDETFAEEKIPSATAVNGSRQPRIAVVVEPIRCTANTNVKSDTKVGIRANKIRWTAADQSGMDSGISPFTNRFPAKIIVAESRMKNTILSPFICCTHDLLTPTM